MKLPDTDRILSEKPLTLPNFLKSYNDGIPAGFPPASTALLQEFRKNNESLFRRNNAWSLDQHRKKVMDWLPARCRAVS